MQVKARSFLLGIASFLPIARNFVCGGTGGTVSARYCYSVWLRHLVKALGRNGCAPPRTVAELGPGDSLGIGLSAVLSGADRYFALDVIEHARLSKNTEVLEELTHLFRARSPIPGDDEFPLVYPKLPDYHFPKQILTEEHLRTTLSEQRVNAIREALCGRGGSESSIEIQYIAPWHDDRHVRVEEVDFILSQAVLEHVEDLDGTYSALFRWLRPGGLMSHQVDFRSHGLTRDWNGHWALSDGMWRIVKGTRPYLINRHPYSVHRAALLNAGFRLSAEERRTGPTLARSQLAPRYLALSDADLTTSGAYLQAIKPS